VFRSAPLLAIALACGCAFDSFEGGRNETLGQEGGEEENGSGPPMVGATRGVADGGGEGEGESGPPPSTSGPSLPPGEAEGGHRLDFGAPPTSGSEDGMQIDCDGASTFELTIEDAMVFDPMQSDNADGVGLAAYSMESDAGDVDFIVDIVCPGPYYVHALVADSWGGVHSGQDPDSYDVSWPGGSATWFYGCQTEEIGAGWHWLGLMSGVVGGYCDETTRPELALAEGSHTIRFHNREGMTWDGYVAAIARVVVTNDASYQPS
jgi:hypothetical protein